MKITIFAILLLLPFILAPSCQEWNCCECVERAKLLDFELDVKTSSGGCESRTEKHIIAYFEGYGKSLWSCDTVDGDYHKELCDGAVVGQMYCVKLDPNCKCSK